MNNNYQNDPTRGQCNTCGGYFKLAGSGLAQHRARCADRLQQRIVDQQQLHQANEEVRRNMEMIVDGVGAPAVQPRRRQEQEVVDRQDDIAFEEAPYDPQPNVGLDDDEEMVDNGPVRDRPYILKTFHERSQKDSVKIYLDEAKQAPAGALPPEPSTNPFSIADFIFAERMIATSASAADVNFILTNMHNGTFVDPGATKISYKNCKEMLADVDKYAEVFESFEKTNISVPHVDLKGDTVMIEREVWRRNPILWLEELLRDPDLNGAWDWHAFNQTLHIPGKEDDPLITTPMSATDAWNTEGKLPDGPHNVQIPLSYYSDKSNAARFATVPIHPVSLRPSNLAKELANRNGHWFSNGLVGFVPNISAPAGEEGSASNWPVTKRRLYHESLKWIFEPLSGPSKNGYGVLCGDGCFRVAFPRIMIANLDLEEQFICGCGRGVAANHPCPRCKVHKSEQHQLLIPLELRTHDGSQATLTEYQSLVTRKQTGQAQALLTAQGLYPIENAFWTLANTDIHDALSFETVHSIWIGTFGSHYFPLIIGTLSSERKGILVDRFQSAPSFSNLKRIYKIDALSFADGKKYFSVLQQILPYIADLVRVINRPLLRLIRSLADIAMHVEMKWQTGSRIAKGRLLIAEMDRAIKDVVPLFPDKNFAFPKQHQFAHLFDDFISKGTDEYLNCKVGENMHQGLIQHYAASNKKEYIAQICQRECRVLSLSRIRYRLLKHQELVAECGMGQDPEDEDELEQQQRDLQEVAGARLPQRDHPPDPQDARAKLEARLATSIGSPNSTGETNSSAIETSQGYFPSQRGKAQFYQFHQKLVTFKQFLADTYAEDLNVPMDIGVRGDGPIEVFPYCLIKHSFYSLDNGAFKADLIRCNPSFYGQPRFDTVLVNFEDVERPARLHLVFEFIAHGVTWQAALVSYFSPKQHSPRDRDIRMRRYREEEMSHIVLLAIIVRSCYMSPVSDSNGQVEYYLNGLISGDVDLYQRVEHMYIND